MTKNRPSSRPSYTPRGYEWLPDAYNRVFELLGAEGGELVHQMLAEGDVDAMLLNRVGNDYPVPKRMWRKYPDERKVYPRFEDGWMRVSLKPKKFVWGWLFVPEGAFSSLTTSLHPNASNKGPDKKANASTVDAATSGGSDTLARPRGRRRRARDAAMRALAALYPKGVPGTPWKTILAEVNDWLVENGEPQVSEATVTRAANDLK